MTNGLTTEETVSVSSGQTTTVRLSGSVQVCRMAQVILFESARSFIKADQKPAIEQAFSFGLRRAANGEPEPKPDQFLLIVGHTDQVGRTGPNQALSKRRASAAWAVFAVEASHWEQLYQTESWGIDELGAMSAEVDIGSSSALIPEYQADAARRLDLIDRYLLFLRPNWVPIRSPVIRPNIVSSPSPPILGCGESFLTDGSDADDRRVEFFYFLTATSGVRNEDDCPSETVYRTWQTACGLQAISIMLEILNEYNEPYSGPFTLTLPNGGSLDEQTDSLGSWSRPNSPAGEYTLEVQGREITALPDGRQSSTTFRKTVNASSSLIRVQALDLDRWLIPQQHGDIPRFTRSNQVTALIDGKTAFKEMHDAFRATGDGGYIYITGWDIVPDIHLLERSRGAASQLQTILGSARGRGVDARILLWFGNAIRIPGRPHRGGLGVATWEAFPWANIFVDNKTRGPGSHHQKTAAIRTREALVSFVGGIDLTADRWDTSAHRFPDPDADYELSGGQPWHDVHAKVQGPAAGDIETNFRQRWNDTDRVTGFPGPTPPVPVHAAPGPLPSGTHVVQTLRTFPHHATVLGRAWHYDFVPTGEFGLRLAYRRAIDNARNYIYIEDQYFISDREISPLIAVAMRRSSQLQVILVTAPEPDTPPTDAFDFHQNAFLNNLRAVDPARVQIFHLVNGFGAGARGIYCHSKVCIIDDIWAIIGSCNMSQRSLTHDSEISIAVLDGRVENGRRKFARDLRKALWSEHLGLTAAEMPLIDDPMAGVGEWRSRAGRSPAHAVVHVRPPGADSPAWNTLVDPDGSRP